VGAATSPCLELVVQHACLSGLEAGALIGGDMSEGFGAQVRAAINRTCRENGSNTPDFILASYLCSCLDVFDAAILARDAFYGVKHSPVPVTDAPATGGVGRHVGQQPHTATVEGAPQQ
jgi:hypothetical protein